MTDTKYRQRLNDAYNEFERLKRGLSPRTLQLRLTSLANKGPDQIDPFIRALARRELDAMSARSTVAEAQEELQGLRRVPDDMHFPNQPDKRALMALRKEELEQSIAGETARLLSLASDPMVEARAEAIAAYKKQDADAERTAARIAAADALEVADADPKRDEIAALAARWRKG